MKGFRWLVAGMMSAGLFTAVACSELGHKDKDEGDEVKVSIDQVPAAVRATLMKESGGAKIDSVDKEMKKGQTIYETDVKLNGKNWEIQVAEDGKLISKKLDEEEDEKGEKK